MAEEIIEGQPGEQAPASVDNGGETYQVPDKFKGATPEETIAKMGKSYSELEKQLGNRNNTPSEIAEIRNTLNELRSSLEPKPQQDPNDLRQQHKEYLGELGFATKDDLTKAREEGRKQAEYDRINENLSTKYDGKDGRPKFDRKEIEDFAKENKSMGYVSLHPETLYKIRHEQELADWRVKEALRGNKSPGVPTSKKGSSPKEGKDISKMSEEERRDYMKSKFDSGE